MIEQVTRDIITFSATMTLADLYSKYPGKVLFVEPFSSKMPIAKFIGEGGLGYGSFTNGTFSSKLFNVQTGEFTAGSNYSTLTNAGYPLHRLVERAPHQVCPVPAGGILRVTVPVREKPAVKVLFKSCSVNDGKPSPAVSNFLWVNDAAAKVFGAAGAGAISLFEEEPEGEGEPAEGIYEKRFFEDALPSGQVLLKVLTQPSNLKRIKELSNNADGIFVALYVHLGVLVVLSGDSERLKKVAEEVARLPLTFILRAHGR